MIISKITLPLLLKRAEREEIVLRAILARSQLAGKGLGWVKNILRERGWVW